MFLNMWVFLFFLFFFMFCLDSASKCAKNKLTGLYKGLCEGERGDVENRQENIGLWGVFFCFCFF